MRGDLDEMRERMGDGRSRQLARDGAAEFVSNPERLATFAEAFALVSK